MGEKTNRGKRGPILGRKAGQVSTSITRSVDHMPRFRAKNNTDLLLPFVPPKTTTVGYVSAHFLRSVSTGSAKSFFILSFFFSLSLFLSPFLLSLFFSYSVSLAPFEGRLLHTETTITFPRRYPLSWLFAGLRSTENATASRREGERGRVSRETTVCEYPGTLSIYVLFKWYLNFIESVFNY